MAADVGGPGAALAASVNANAASGAIGAVPVGDPAAEDFAAEDFAGDSVGDFAAEGSAAARKAVLVAASAGGSDPGSSQTDPGLESRRRATAASSSRS